MDVALEMLSSVLVSYSKGSSQRCAELWKSIDSFTVERRVFTPSVTLV